MKRLDLVLLAALTLPVLGFLATGCRSEPEPEPEEPPCDYDEFTCDDGTCFGCYQNDHPASPEECVCDGWPHCDDFSDEAGCAPCGPDQFECTSVEACIPEWWHCDEEVHCPGGEDEEGCCYDHAYEECWQGDVWSYDSCGEREYIDEYCEDDEVCIDDDCEDDCVPNHELRCWDHHVYWYDSCGERGELAENPDVENDTWQDAWSVNGDSTYPDLTLCPGRDDWFQVQIPAGTRLEVHLHDPGGEQPWEMEVSLHDLDGSELPTWPGVAEVGESYTQNLPGEAVGYTVESAQTVLILAEMDHSSDAFLYDLELDFQSCAAREDTDCYGSDPGYSVWVDGCGNEYALRENCSGNNDCWQGECGGGPGDDDDAVSTGGCADGSDEQTYSSTMVGCNGSSATIAQADAAALCASGWHLCSLSEYIDRGGPGTSSTGCSSGFCPRWLSDLSNWWTFDCACDDSPGDRMITLEEQPAPLGTEGLTTEGSGPTCQEYWSVQPAGWSGDCACLSETPGCLYVETRMATASAWGAVCCD